MSALLEARGVEKTYRMGSGLVHALRGIDLRLERGELVALAGPSGSGKSTLLHLLGCLDLPDAGVVELEGVDTARLRGAARTQVLRRRVGFVFQSHALIPVLSASENVEYPLLVAGVPRGERVRRALQALDEVGLAARARHRPDQLSGGEQQRVAIARALVHEPVILLADELTAHLDSATGAQALDLLDAHRAARGTTIVIATHDPRVMARAARRVRLQDGRVVSDPPGVG